MDRKIPVLPLLGAIGPPVFILGSALLTGYVNGGRINAGFWPNFLTVALVSLACLVVCAAAFLHFEVAGRVFLTALYGLALLACLVCAGLGSEDWLLLGSGETAACTVTDVSDRTVQQTDATLVVHDHRLVCDGPGPELVTSTETLAQPGEPAEVVYDPDGQFETRVTADLGYWEAFAWLTAGGFVLAVVLGWVEFMVEDRR